MKTNRPGDNRVAGPASQATDGERLSPTLHIRGRNTTEHTGIWNSGSSNCGDSRKIVHYNIFFYIWDETRRAV
jgi:hypothetical protein